MSYTNFKYKIEQELLDIDVELLANPTNESAINDQQILEQILQWTKEHSMFLVFEKLDESIRGQGGVEDETRFKYRDMLFDICSIPRIDGGNLNINNQANVLYEIQLKAAQNSDDDDDIIIIEELKKLAHENTDYMMKVLGKQKDEWDEWDDTVNDIMENYWENKKIALRQVTDTTLPLLMKKIDSTLIQVHAYERITSMNATVDASVFENKRVIKNLILSNILLLHYVGAVDLMQPYIDALLYYELGLVIIEFQFVKPNTSLKKLGKILNEQKFLSLPDEIKQKYLTDFFQLCSERDSKYTKPLIEKHAKSTNIVIAQTPKKNWNTLHQVLNSLQNSLSTPLTSQEEKNIVAELTTDWFDVSMELAYINHPVTDIDETIKQKTSRKLKGLQRDALSEINSYSKAVPSRDFQLLYNKWNTSWALLTPSTMDKFASSKLTADEYDFLDNLRAIWTLKKQSRELKMDVKVMDNSILHLITSYLYEDNLLRYSSEYMIEERTKDRNHYFA